jgi:methylenetetrahydrofolate reductase (NADPH)
MCSALIEGGVDHLHFYTLNKPSMTHDICHALGISPRTELENVA